MSTPVVALSLMVLEILNLSLMLPGLFERWECAQVAAFTRLRIFLARVNAKLSRFEFADHWVLDASLSRLVAYGAY
jgi:hypothetical protein